MFQKHIPTLDGLRGFAALWVVISHFTLVGFSIEVPGPTGGYGVFLFFILSGFLMGHLYLPQPFALSNVLRYGIARIARVVPIFYLSVTVCYILSTIWGHGFIYYLTTQDYLRLLTFNGSAYTFWSVAPEVQFYFLFVGIWWLSSRRDVVLTCALIPALFVGALLMFVQPFFPGAFVFSKLHVFLAGVLLASMTSRLKAPEDWSRSWSMMALQVVTIAIGVGLTITPYFPSHILNPFGLPHDDAFNAIYGDYRWTLLMAVLLLAMAIETPISRFLFGNALMRRVGQYSFSIYLLHVPVMAGVKSLVAPLGLTQMEALLAALAGVAALGPICFYLFESPSQIWARRMLNGWAERLCNRRTDAVETVSHPAAAR